MDELESPRQGAFLFPERFTSITKEIVYRLLKMSQLNWLFLNSKEG